MSSHLDASATRRRGDDPVPLLLVDDKPENLVALEALLLPLGYRLVSALSGHEALAAAEETDFALVLLDVRMPGLDGFETAGAMRKRPRSRHTPIIFVTANDPTDAVVHAYAHGAVDFLPKPLDPDVLRAKVAVFAELHERNRQRELDAAVALSEHARRVVSATLSTTLASVGDGIIVTDAKGLVSQMNGVAETVTGWSSSEAKGRPFDDVLSALQGDDRQPLESPVTRAVRDGPSGASPSRALLLRRDGTEVPVELGAAPVFAGPGDLAGIVVVIHRGAASVHLDALERAEGANRMKDEFLATASHELRTPLNSILGWAQMLRSGQLDPSGFFRAAEIIERNARAQVQLIEDILDGSRMITGKLHLEIRTVDMAAVVQMALEAVRPAADAKQIELVVGLDADASHLVGDPDRLQQVLWNLANNAIKFTPKGGRVEVRLERSGTSIHLVVKDSGQGIPPEFLPHVFERFRQAQGTTTRRHGGLGLGLALVSHIVEAHGGTVHAASEGTGRGATFTASFPVPAVHVQAPEATPAHVTPADRPPSATAIGLVGVRILVVDDEADARELVATVLRGQGAEVVTAANAREAFELLVADPPTLLISDIGMPETDGYELVRRLRTQAGKVGASLPAIALTAYSREKDRRRALEAGFQTHLAKPVEPPDLLKVVTSLLDYIDRQPSADTRDLALQRADTFLKFERLLEAQGVHAALRFLNSRTPHRFTAIYRFDPPMLRNVHLVDSYAPDERVGSDSPLAETYCSIVGDTQQTFTTDDAPHDERLVGHPAQGTVRSYCGVLLTDASGAPYGTLCHFDLVPCDVPVSEMPLMEAAAAALMATLRRAKG